MVVGARPTGVAGNASAALRRLGRHEGAALPPPVTPPSAATSAAPSGAAVSTVAVAVAAVAAAASAAAAAGVYALPLRCEVAPGVGAPLPELVEHLPFDLRRSKGVKVRLYQFESCPFCRKARSCLDFHRIPYEIVEVNPLTKAETKAIAPDYKKVPILRVTCPDDSSGKSKDFQLRDSKTIVRSLFGGEDPGISKKVPPPKPTPSTSKMWSEQTEQGSVEEQWVAWTDGVLVQCIVLNVYRTLREAAETFEYLLTHPSFPWYAQRSAAMSGTVVMWGVAMRRKSKYDISDVRAALFEALEEYAGAVQAGGGKFLGGKKPGSVDFNVFGILRSTESTQTERDIMEKCPAIVPWFTSMMEVVGPSCAINAGDIHRGA